MIVPEHQLNVFREATQQARQITILTGAGISAESGIPTFRGKEGYWTVGSKAYHPQEMATHAMFCQQPLEVWQWYCYRRSICANAQPNAGHKALVQLEEILEDRFSLVTQNVDGLHLRAGNSLPRTFQIHGNINTMRCSNECTRVLSAIPDFIPVTPVSKSTAKELLERLLCPLCQQRMRPHVLWFDESYDETFFRFESSIKLAQQTDLLIIVGTSGATTLPNHIVQLVLQKGGLVFDVNTEPNLFGDLASQNQGHALQGPSGSILPELVAAIR